MKKAIIFALKLQVLVFFLGIVVFVALFIVGEPTPWDVLWKTLVSVHLIVLFSCIFTPVAIWWFDLKL